MTDITREEGCERRGFLHGVAWAAAVPIRSHDLPTLALGLLREAGATLADLTAAGAAPHDLDAIRDVMAGRNNRKPRNAR